MSEYIKLDDSVYFTANFYHPVSGFSYVADATPRYLVYESGATLILQNNMTARSTIVGSYWGNFVASTANGFTTGRFYDIQVSGIVAGVGGFNSVKQFTLGLHDANIVSVSGQNVSPKTIYNANVTQVSGVNVSLSDFGASAVAIRTEMDANSLKMTAISGSVAGLAGAAMRGTDNAALATDLMAISGIISTLDADIYYAAIKYISDVTNSTDEFAVQWFKNDQPVMSGSLTAPAISVYNTSTGAALISHQGMSYASPNLGVVRYNKTPMVLASGEPYLVETSGTIDAINRTWRTIVGIDLL